ncbi:MAG: peptidylprolyl isomerase [Halieaceae bacterium]|jgi:peptidyl-prolyl cis-trans isomerase B (cyclophilin B)|nr:peptidylprolyl isomerase [Halieaceae bacterium]
MVTLHTTYGPIKIELDAEKAPGTVANFLSYVREGFYDGTIFHRVINNFMIQGGGFDADMKQKPTQDPIENEADNGLKNDFGTVAMARTMDPHSATAQFFINVKDNDFLNHSGKTMQGWGYCVFGRVVEGEEVLEKIRAVPTTSRSGHQDVPVETVIIERATLEEGESEATDD